MAEEQQVVRSVNWTEVFGFTQIFKGFKMAVHPSKLALCLAALVLLFVGGWVMDLVWSGAGVYAYPNEITQYALTSPGSFSAAKRARTDPDARRRAAARLVVAAESQQKFLSDYVEWLGELPSGSHLADAFQKQLTEHNKDLDPTLTNAEDLLKRDDSVYELLDDAEEQFDKEAEKIDDLLAESVEDAEAQVKEIADDEEERQAADRLEREHRMAQAALAGLKVKRSRQLRQVRGEPVFSSMLDYQWRCVRSAVAAVCYGNFTSGLKNYQQMVDARGPRLVGVKSTIDADLAGADLGMAQALPTAGPDQEPPGFLFFALMGVRGVAWLIAEHPFYAAIYLLFAMCVCAVFGGAVNRVAALHFARDEKISIPQALRFSCGKFFSFFSAPLIPIGLIFLLGVLLMVGALLTNIPVAGEIIVGLLLFVALLLGLAIAFLFVGLVGGAGLMYPTIAAEGSDSFDAISRSFSYIFARPWRTILYGLVALVYGVVTYVFVRLFAFVALKATHAFGEWGVFVGGHSLGPEADKLDVIWPEPTFGSLCGPVHWEAMGSGQVVGAFIINAWVFLVAALVTAYMLSYAASATTVIYFLLRRKVDATDLDDVYVEEPEEEPLVAPEPAGEEPAGGEEPSGGQEPPAGQAPAGEAPPADEDAAGEDKEGEST
jgi:hypothetical protein